MNDALIYILCMLGVVAAAGIGVSIGVKLTLETLARMDAAKFREIVQDLRSANDNPGMETIQEVLPKPVTRLTLTAAGNSLLAHDANTQEFIAQGMDSRELILSALSRFPGRAFTIAIEDPSVEVTP